MEAKRICVKRSNNITELPDEILIDILSRLPIKAIFLCKRVCKLFLNHLVENPEFAKVHLSRSPSSLILQPRVKRNTPQKPFCLLNLEHDGAIPDPDAKITLCSDLYTCNLKFLTQRYTVANSCNGLVCLFKGYYGGSIYILNPITGDYITIPRPQNKLKPESCRFGFCDKTNQYKILRLFRDTTEGEIYTVGSPSWRSIAGLPKSLHPNHHYDCFFNGFVHWVVDDPDSSEFIRAFCFKNETFRAVPPPPQFGQNKKKPLNTRLFSLGVFGGCLTMVDHSSVHHDIWVMKEYGVQDSWSKVFVINRTVMNYCFSIIPLNLLNDGIRMVLLLHNNDLVYYKYGDKSPSYFSVTIPGTPDIEQTFSHLPSFVSLKNIVKGSKLKVSNVKTRKGVECQSILEFPFEILIQILSRLPIKDIFHCKCVCKVFLSLLSAPEFINFHLAQSPTSLIIRSHIRRRRGCRCSGLRKPPKDIYLLNLEHSDISHRDARIKLTSDLSGCDLKFFTRFYTVANSCNGLVCLSRGDVIYILNPITGDYISIPETKNIGCRISFRFGFCDKTNQYKVLRPFGSYGAEIYTLGSHSWRRIEGVRSLYYLDTYHCYDGLINGFAHWYVAKKENSDFIYSFDFRNETFQAVPPPSGFSQDKKKFSSLGVFGGCLCVVDFSSLDQIDIWVMNKYGFQESWTKLFIIRKTVGYPHVSIMPIKLLNDGETMVMIHDYTTLISYKVGERCPELFKYFSIPGTFSYFKQIYTFRPSFVSLKEIVKGSKLEVFNVKQGSKLSASLLHRVGDIGVEKRNLVT